MSVLTDLMEETQLISCIKTHIQNITENNKCFVPEKRIEIMEFIMKSTHNNLEHIKLVSIKLMFDYDLAYMKNIVSNWKNKNRANAIIININNFIDCQIDFQIYHEKMSFYEHAVFFAKLAILISTISTNTNEISKIDLDTKYDHKIKTIVKHVIHPLGHWSVKNELENQYYAKFIFHISKTGLLRVQTMNKTCCMRISCNNKFIPIRLIAVPCDEIVGYDGIENSGAYKVLTHDLIHAGFLRYHYDRDRNDFMDKVEKIGVIYETYMSDNNIDKKTKNIIQASFFMWTHELTTSVFVDGFPEKIPTPSMLYNGLSGSLPQKLLRLTAKFGIIPSTFSKEINIEASLLESLGIAIGETNVIDQNEHEKIKEIMNILDIGYKYLYNNFNDYYGSRSHLNVLTNRIISKIKTFFNYPNAFFH